MLKLKNSLSIGDIIALLNFINFVPTSVSRTAFYFFNVSMIRDINFFSEVEGLRNKYTDETRKIIVVFVACM